MTQVMARVWLSPLFFAACTSTAPGTDASSADYSSVVAADRPVSYWRFGDSPGDRANDAASDASARDELGRANGTRAGGVTTGAPGAVAGDPNGAFAFDGKTGVVVAPDVYAFEGTRPFSVEVWIAPARTGGSPLQRIVNHRVGPPHTGWRLVLDETKRVVFDRWNEEVSVAAIAGPLPLDAYTHVVGVYDGAELALYLDGKLAAKVPDTHAIGPFAAKLTWGAASTSTLDFFAGRLDEAAIYDFALGADRVAAHKKAALR